MKSAYPPVPRSDDLGAWHGPFDSPQLAAADAKATGATYPKVAGLEFHDTDPANCTQECCVVDTASRP